MNYRFYRREFLNNPGHHSTGHILAYVEETTVEKNWSGDINFTLADCNRQINLSFDIDDAEERANSLYKMDLIIKSLQEFREAFLVECEVQEQRTERKAREDEEYEKRLDKPTSEPGE